MKISDFKVWDRPVFLKTVEKFIKDGRNIGINCKSCPFKKENSIDKLNCYDDDKYRDSRKSCWDNDTILVESAKAFKKMVEEEKEKKIGVSMCDRKIFITLSMKTGEITIENKKSREEKVEKDFKVGDSVKIKDKHSHHYDELAIVSDLTSVISGHIMLEIDGKPIGSCSIELLEKVEDKQEPFELKEGMKFKTLDNSSWSEDVRSKIFTVEKITKNRYTDETLYEAKESPYWDLFYSQDIDWEATRKLNEVKEEPKQELYVIWNPKCKNPHYKHTSLEDAEKEAERLAKENPNQEFYVLKAFKKVVGTVKIESDNL